MMPKKPPHIYKELIVKPGNINDYVGNLVGLSKVLEDFSDSIYVIDVKTLKPIYMNRSLLQIMGYTPKQIEELGEDWAKSVTNPEDLKLIFNHILNYQKMCGNQSSRVLYRMKDAQNSWRLFESIDAPLSYDKDMHVLQVVGITRDVTKSFEYFDSTDHCKPFLQKQHRCRTCKKLLGTENLKTAMVEIKCNRCGEINSFSHTHSVKDFKK